MLQTISKSQFKAKALEYFRQVEKKSKHFVVTHNGKPVADIIPHKAKDPFEHLKKLRGTVLKYVDPDKPAVPISDWEVLR